MNFAKIELVFAALVILTIIPVMSSANADEVTVSIPQGTSVPGCEETNDCWLPSTVSVNPGDEVVWSNDDTGAHTVTSGSPQEGIDGIFDSGLFMAGTNFTQKFDTLGEYNYFCMIHPWMVGSVLVVPGGGLEIPLGTITIGGEDKPEETVVSGLSSDGSVRVEVTTMAPISGEMMNIEVAFRDFSGGGLKEHANYDVVVSQNGMEVLSEVGAHEHEGTGMHTTAALESDDPVDIEVTIQGFGLPNEEANWTGPKGEVVMFNVVPEFGTISIIVLGVAIFSIIALSTRTKLIQNSRI